MSLCKSNLGRFVLIYIFGNLDVYIYFQIKISNFTCEVLWVGVALSATLSQHRVFLWDSLLILYVQSDICRGVPQTGGRNAEGVEPSLHCNGNAVHLMFNGSRDMQEPHD